MLIGVTMLLLPVVLIYAWFSRTPEPAPQAVDWRPVVARAQEESPYPVAVPRNLPETWTVVRARWTRTGEAGLNQAPAVGNTFQLGFISPDRMYIGLDQRDADPRGLVDDVSRGGSDDGTSRVGQVEWRRMVSPDDRTRVPVRTDKASTVAISGDLPYEALEAFAATLN